MEIILIRHGEAEEVVDDKEDATRQLTVRGRKLAKKTTKGLAKLLPPKTKVQVWTNPLTRSLQTAEIVADGLGVKVKLVNVLDITDFSGMMEFINRNVADQCVVIIGQKFFLEEFTRQLTGTKLAFKKCSAVSFKVVNEPAITCELQWFIQPRCLKRIR